MDYRRLGKTGLEVSAVSYGTAPLGDMFNAADEATAIQSVHEALGHEFASVIAEIGH